MVFNQNNGLDFKDFLDPLVDPTFICLMLMWSKWVQWFRLATDMQTSRQPFSKTTSLSLD